MAAKCWFSRKNLRNLLNMLFWLFFPLIFLTCLLFFSNAIKKSQQKTKSRTQICIFPDLFPMFSRFPKLFLQNQHFAAKFPFFYLFILLFYFFWVFCWVSVFQVFLFWLFFVFYFQSFFELFFVFLFYSFFFFGISNSMGIQIHNYILYTVSVCW